MDLANRTVLITGGSSGIGLGLAKSFIKAKSKVIICGRNQKKLTAVKDTLKNVTTIICALEDAVQRKRLSEDVIREYPELDVLVNNAGVQRYIDIKKGYGELKSGEDEISINFIAPVELISLFIDHLVKRPSAAIINVSSALGFMPMVSTPVYNATKAAIHTYTLVLRQQLKGTSVKVIEIVPPMVDTDLNKKGRDLAQAKFRGISLAEYIPTVIKGLEGKEETIFYGDGKKVLTEPREETENHLLNQLW